MHLGFTLKPLHPTQNINFPVVVSENEKKTRCTVRKIGWMEHSLKITEIYSHSFWESESNIFTK